MIPSDVLVDMVQMQIQPAIMDNYRRFVMVVETHNDEIESDGVSVSSVQRESSTHSRLLQVEFLPVTKFDFRDEFFAST